MLEYFFKSLDHQSSNLFSDNLSCAQLRREIARRPESVHERDHRNSTPLIEACAHQNWTVVPLLLSAGAEVNAVDSVSGLQFCH